MLTKKDFEFVGSLKKIVLLKLVKDLPELQKKLIVLHFWEGKALFEISKKLRVCYSKALQEFDQALACLKQQCEREFYELDQAKAVV